MKTTTTTTTPPAAMLFLVFLLSGGLFSASSSKVQSINDFSSSSSSASASSQDATKIMTVMCTSESCSVVADASSSENDMLTASCQQYITPLNTCYNAQTLFPNDESWSDLDIYDEMIMMNLKRTFYQSNDGTCAGRQKEGANTKVDNDASGDDSFILPLDVCVGPFGPPRPWGKFTLVYDIGSRRGDDDNNVVISAM